MLGAKETWCIAASPELAGQHQCRLAVHVAAVQHAADVLGLALATALSARRLKRLHQQLEVVQPPLACDPITNWGSSRNLCGDAPCAVASSAAALHAVRRQKNARQRHRPCRVGSCSVCLVCRAACTQQDASRPPPSNRRSNRPLTCCQVHRGAAIPHAQRRRGELGVVSQGLHRTHKQASGTINRRQA